MFIVCDGFEPEVVEFNIVYLANKRQETTFLQILNASYFYTNCIFVPSDICLFIKLPSLFNTTVVNLF